MSGQAIFDAASSSSDAIQRAAYRLCDRIAIELRSVGTEYHCEVWAADGGEPTAADMATFRIEVTDQVLRERIRDATSAVRNTILALAFSQADLGEVE